MTKKLKQIGRQGDLLIRKIDKFPSNLKKAKEENGVFILAHSETGHNHIIDKNKAQLLIDETNTFIAYLEVTEDANVEHLRSFYTHETVELPIGLYEIRRQREYSPQGYRRAMD